MALAISTNALYPLPIPEPVVPSVVYGVPDEPKPVITPIKTEYTYTIPAVHPVELHHEEIVAPTTPVVTHPVAPVAPFLPPNFAYPYLPQFYNNPFLNYAPNYPAPLPLPSSELFVPPQIHAPVYVAPEEQVAPVPFSYAYSYPHVAAPQLIYGAPGGVYPELHRPLADFAAGQVFVSGVAATYNYTAPFVHNGVVETPVAPFVHPGFVEAPAAPFVHPGFVEAPVAPFVHPAVIEAPAAPFVQPAVVEAPAAPFIHPAVVETPFVQPALVETPVVPAVPEVVPVPQEPLVVSYEYKIPQVVDQVVVQEIPAPVVPQTVYGVPQ